MRPSLVAFVVVACLAAPWALGRYGESRRTVGLAAPPGSASVEVAVVAQPRQAYNIWRAQQLRGRTLLFVDTRWPAVNADALAKVPVARFYPLELFNYARMLEAERLSSDTFLYVATQSGFIRKVIAALSRPGFDQVSASLQRAKHVERRPGGVFNAHMGFPRVFTSVEELVSPGEPVLLYVGAGIFRDHAPHELLQRLRSAGVVTDHIILCTGEGDTSVGPSERARAAAFSRLLRPERR